MMIDNLILRRTRVYGLWYVVHSLRCRVFNLGFHLFVSSKVWVVLERGEGKGERGERRGERGGGRRFGIRDWWD